jgi:hypothetical protein
MGQKNLNRWLPMAVAKYRLASGMGLKSPPKMALVAFHSCVLCNGVVVVWVDRWFRLQSMHLLLFGSRVSLSRRTRYRYIGAMQRQ